jgi:hypothetical protein
MIDQCFHIVRYNLHTNDIVGETSDLLIKSNNEQWIGSENINRLCSNEPIFFLYSKKIHF